jgi:UDP-N-acetylmuramoyl-tripeptide--D-alanyl-D-alanine ligase
MQLTLREILEILNASGAPSPSPAVDTNAVATGYSIDTRTLKSGDLFFAICGPRFDGHDFALAAFDRGACAVVVNEEWWTRRRQEVTPLSGSTRKNWIVVPETTQALQTLGAQVRRWWGGQLIAITGSAGKTTTKEICAVLLASHRRVYKSEGNLNNLLGVPLTLLRLDAGAEIAVLELAMSARKEIRALTRIAQPNAGVVTNVNPVHLQFFSTVEEIALAKRELVEELGDDAVAVLNADDPRVKEFSAHSRARVVKYGEHDGADVRIQNIRLLNLEGSAFDVVLRSGEMASCRLPLLGKIHVWNATAAIAAALEFGMPFRDAARGLEALRPAPMRGEVLRFQEGFTVINDAYNSNPRALLEMISTLAEVHGFKRKIVAAGEMLELGAQSRAMHSTCGESMAAAGIHVLIAVQGDAEAMSAGARHAGMNSENVFFVPTAVAAGEKLCSLATAGDLILLKGSRGVRMELALDALRQEFSMEAH